MTDREIAERIAHDVAVESGMAHESLSALTAVIQEGIDRTLAATSLSAGEPDGMETTADADELIKWHELAAAIATQNKNDPLANWHKRQAQLVKRLLAREAKAAPDPQSEIGLRAHLADLSARGLKP
jgi:hypothetical protein